MGPWHTFPVFVFVWHEPRCLENAMTRLKPESVAGQHAMRVFNHVYSYGTVGLNDSL
jgi:hypothetical protein